MLIVDDPVTDNAAGPDDINMATLVRHRDHTKMDEIAKSFFITAGRGACTRDVIVHAIDGAELHVPMDMTGKHRTNPVSYKHGMNMRHPCRAFRHGHRAAITPQRAVQTNNPGVNAVTACKAAVEPIQLFVINSKN